MSQPDAPRITMPAIDRMDAMARQFRRALRDVALLLHVADGSDDPLPPQTVDAAAVIVCRTMADRLEGQHEPA